MKITIIWRKEVKRKKHPWYIRFFFPFPNERRNVNDKNQMVNLVKQDEEVSLQYMKIFEREEMLIEQGRKEEQANTELERQRAEKEKARADQLEKELQELKDKPKKFQ